MYMCVLISAFNLRQEKLPARSQISIDYRVNFRNSRRVTNVPKELKIVRKTFSRLVSMSFRFCTKNCWNILPLESESMNTGNLFYCIHTDFAFRTLDLFSPSTSTKYNNLYSSYNDKLFCTQQRVILHTHGNFTRTISKKKHIGTIVSEAEDRQ